jgi:hypothetical protein
MGCSIALNSFRCQIQQTNDNNGVVLHHFDERSVLETISQNQINIHLMNHASVKIILAFVMQQQMEVLRIKKVKVKLKVKLKVKVKVKK